MINGFGKSIGLLQVEELGTLETPIALTNTFAVGALAQAQIRAAIRANPRIGREWPTVNPLVFECNDGYLNDIQALAVTERHFDHAFDSASTQVARGISEEFPLAGARSLYGATKLASELFIEEYAYAYGLRAVVDRCGVLAGPWQMGKVDQGFIALWVARHLFEGRLSYIGFGGTGKQVRDLLHVEDLVELIDRQLSAPGEWNGRTDVAFP